MVDIVGNVIRWVFLRKQWYVYHFLPTYLCAGFCLSTVCSFSGSVSKITQVYIPQLEKNPGLTVKQRPDEFDVFEYEQKLCRIQRQRGF